MYFLHVGPAVAHLAYVIICAAEFGTTVCKSFKFLNYCVSHYRWDIVYIVFTRWLDQVWCYYETELN